MYLLIFLQGEISRNEQRNITFPLMNDIFPGFLDSQKQCKGGCIQSSQTDSRVTYGSIKIPKRCGDGRKRKGLKHRQVLLLHINPHPVDQPKLAYLRAEPCVQHIPRFCALSFFFFEAGFSNMNKFSRLACFLHFSS